MTALITPEGLARLDAALAWIDAHPEQHDQGIWFSRKPGCQTTCCLAGAVSILAGAEPIFDEKDSSGWLGDTGYFVRTQDGRKLPVDAYAGGLLGVTGWGREDLFYGASDRADLGKVRDLLAASLDGGS